MVNDLRLMKALTACCLQERYGRTGRWTCAQIGWDNPKFLRCLEGSKRGTLSGVTAELGNGWGSVADVLLR